MTIRGPPDDDDGPTSPDGLVDTRPKPVSPNAYERSETEENVEVEPGETKVILRVEVDGALWQAVGTNDETYSEYQYYVDDEAVFDEPLKSPLGLYNDPYHFPRPIPAANEIRVEVTRDSDADGSAEYFSKVDHTE